MENADVIIIGSGIAAMQLAQNLSSSFFVRLITKSTLKNSNSYIAQGGIAASVSNDDDYLLHFQDTIEAGRNFHNEKKVLELVKEAPNIINQLIESGIQFDVDTNGNICLGKEGAHSRNRILHCGGDATGKHIMEHFLNSVPKNISISENEFVFELIIHPKLKTCVGVKTKNVAGDTKIYMASHIVLAVGGVGGLYTYTSNDTSIAGDGIALAYLAGAELTDLEFIQFHPTLLSINGKTCGLISEAVRGMGAVLMNDSNEAFMDGKHHLKDLAPRHIVAQEIFNQRSMGREVFLDISMIEDFKGKFPTISTICEQYNIDISNGKIPVAPGCHFFMGGVVIDGVGRTTVDRLYSIGETAWSGVHGANRLASNSLLEGLYYGKKLAEYLNKQKREAINGNNIITYVQEYKIEDLFLPNKCDIQQKMMKNAGIIRNRLQLLQLRKWLGKYDIEGLNLNNLTTHDIQIIFMLIASKLITHAALIRTESRGGHIREDFPLENTSWGMKHIFHTNKFTEVRRVHHECNQIKVNA
ncbi:L-aspartate oxidase [Heyndrickxia sp. NPDC080065]|uniref:L-aspartate oxidase n=1 Tax=Heyndrickxia sp. NPDC080065 TaxID=3390568 RepID=UPI003D051006